MIYQFGDTRFLPSGLDAQVIGERLAQLPSLDPAAVVEDARPELSPLHDAFTWDANRALQLVQINEARYLVASIVKVTVLDDGTRIVGDRAFVHVSQERTSEGPSYLPRLDVLSDLDYRAQFLAQAMSELRSWCDRYHDLSELAPIFAAISATKKSKKIAA